MCSRAAACCSRVRLTPCWACSPPCCAALHGTFVSTALEPRLLACFLCSCSNRSSKPLKSAVNVADHFFDHVWGGSKPGAASGSGSAAGSSRQQQQGPAEEGEDEEEQEEDEESSEEESSDDEGAAARHARKPRPAALWLTTPNGELCSWVVAVVGRSTHLCSVRRSACMHTTAGSSFVAFQNSCIDSEPLHRSFRPCRPGVGHWLQPGGQGRLEPEGTLWLLLTRMSLQGCLA